jgi:acyl carrier protein
MSLYVVPPELSSHGDQIPIGQGIDGVQILVLNQAGQLAGIGELGEIYIRTPYLTRGYVNDEGLTSARFLPNPFRSEAGDRMYRTGDLGRYRPDGTVEYVGRDDGQIKIRGYRMEVGEIETILEQHPEVEATVVVCRAEIKNEKELVAYVVPNQMGAISLSNLRSFLMEYLPEYMIPTAWVFLESLPLTPNGKVDRRALPAPEHGRIDPITEYLPPRSPIEEVLVIIWQEVLGIDEVGAFDNFFDLGGHSLSSIQVISKVEQKLGIRLEFGDLLYQTLGQLAAQCEEMLSQGGPP